MSREPNAIVPQAHLSCDSVQRTRGRPNAGNKIMLSRASMLETTLAFTSTVPLQELSIHQVARHLHVAPSLVRYYIGTRSDLILGTLELFYTRLIDDWPTPTGDWAFDLRRAARHLFENFVCFGGIAAFAARHNSWDVLHLAAQYSGTQAVAFVDRFIGLIKASALSSGQTRIYLNFWVHSIIGMAAAQWFGEPSAQRKEHGDYLASKARYSNLLFATPGLAMLPMDGDSFDQACDLILLGMQRARDALGLPYIDGHQTAPRH